MSNFEQGILNPKEVLKKYWGYPEFRSLQEDIINNALAGNDTLALMPTGGGKSICFQVPGLIFPGLCIVISPLIALMKDQVEQLKRRGINATAIISGMHKHEIDISLDNCIHGNTKFLYLSPERLKSDLFLTRLKQMKVSLIVIDEAHCISQWGYDFRPSYLDIASIKDHIEKKVPILALTATATPLIQKDILEKLGISNARIFKKSFARENLAYRCISSSDKITSLLNLIKSTKGSMIVYVRSRKNTVYYSDLLSKNGFKSAYYHAGLSTQIRDRTQSDWIKNKIQIIVSTNAFGMGIDKPDVRLVIHLDLPDSLEAYYQEAGRAGRDENFAVATLLYSQKDIEDLKSKTKSRFPDLAVLRQAYTAICNYFQMALGSGEMQSFPIDLSDLSKKFNIPVLTLYYSIKELEKHGYLLFEENASHISTLNFLVDNKELYRFQVANPRFDQFIKTITRMYGGELFTTYVRINEDQIASKTLLNHNQVIDFLNALKAQGVIDYIPRSDKPKITFILPRQDTHQAFITQNILNDDRGRYFERMNQMIAYTELKNTCRTNFLQEYFGEREYKECGVCDNCQKSKIDKSASNNSEIILEYIKKYKQLNINDLHLNFPDIESKEIVKILRELSIKEKLIIRKDNSISAQ